MGEGTRHIAGWHPRKTRWLRYGASAWLTVVAMIFATVAMAGTPAAQARGAETGLAPIETFTPADYGGTPQNWAVAQGTDGVMYFGNSQDGVLVFDGAHWRHVPVGDRVTVRSLAIAPGGRVYVGAVGDFGYLRRNAVGRLEYVSLLDKVPADARDFSDVWNVRITPAGVYFATLTGIFRLHAGQISVIKPRSRFHITFQVHDRLYVIDRGHGLMRIVGDTLQPVPGGQRFADERIYALLPCPDGATGSDAMVAGTRAHGWFVFNGKTWRPWSMPAAAAINRGALYGAIWLADGRMAVATLRAGVFVLDHGGHVLRHLSRTNRLATNAVYAVYQDRRHGLWLATDRGIARVDIATPLTQFGEHSGLHGAVLALTRHDGILYAATAAGLFRLGTDAGRNARFRQLSGSPGQNWSFASVDGQLLVAGNEGVFVVHADGSTRQLLQHHEGYARASQVLLVSRRQPSRVFVGHTDGLSVLRWSGGHWIDEGRVDHTRDQARTLAQDAQGHLWMGLWRGGIDRMTFPPDWKGPHDPRAPEVRHFGKAAGLPDGRVRAASLDGKVLFFGKGGVYRFDAAAGKFTLDPDFRHLFPDGARTVSVMDAGRHGELWMYTQNERRRVKQTGRAVRVDGRWQWHVAPLQPLDGTDILAIHEDADGTVWLGGYQTLYRYDQTRKVLRGVPFNVLIRTLIVGDGHVVYAGGSHPEATRIAYAHNRLRVTFAAPDYADMAATRYQVRLQGMESAWSAWSSAAYRDYTNLDPGTYRIEVRARNAYGEESKAATFAFRVLAPWYRTWWAWLAWVIIGVLALFLVTWWRSTVLRRRNHELAALVDLRTSELAHSNEALKDSNEALAEQTVTDPLTGMKNRRYLYDHIAQDMATARRYGKERRDGRQASSVHADIMFMMLDLDHFKAINDNYGHAAGDRVLQHLRAILAAATRSVDTPIRWGGEEFLIVARHVAPDFGPQLAERVRAAVAGHRFDIGDGRDIGCTCSLGFAHYPAFASQPDYLDWEQVVRLADECMYAAKQYGRNAWAGVLPTSEPPADGEVIVGLRTSLAQWPDPGALPIAASWVPGRSEAR